jgi:hypothetical protein
MKYLSKVFDIFLTIAYTVGFFIYFEIEAYKQRKKHKRYIDGSIK